jgi:hypothetical protein
MQSGNQENGADGHDGDALKNAQRTGFEAENVLREQRVGHQSYDDYESEQIQPSPLRSRRNQDSIS